MTQLGVDGTDQRSVISCNVPHEPRDQLLLLAPVPVGISAFKITATTPPTIVGAATGV